MSDTGGLDPATLAALDNLGDPAPEPQEPEPKPEQQEAEPKEPAEEPAEPEAKDPPDDPDAPKPAAEAKPAKTQVQKDIDRLLRDRHKERARADALEQELAAYKNQRQPAPKPPAGDGTIEQREQESPEAFNARVKAEASRLRQEEDFLARCNAVAEKGAQAHADFADARTALTECFGRQMNDRSEFLEAITRLENGHDVFHHLGNHLDETAALFATSSPVDMVMKLKDLSTKLKAPTPPPRQSAAPAPLSTVRGPSGRPSSVINDENAPMDKWANEFLKSMGTA